MRYYEITISDPNTGDVWKPNKDGDGFTVSPGGASFTSYVNGKTVPGALNIEFDYPASPFNIAQGQTFLRIWGVGLKMIGQGSQLSGQNILIKGGMQKGLPLANPAQAGPILDGQIFQGFGNWQGVNQTLDLIINPRAALPEQNIMFRWPANTPLSDALSDAFKTAFAEYKMSDPDINIADLRQGNDSTAHYGSLAELAGVISRRSRIIGVASGYGKDYSGVLITIVGNKVVAWDSKNPRKTIQLAFTDLIGQPTWIDSATVNFKTVLRSDISLGMQVKFPAGIHTPYALTTANAAVPNVPAKSSTVFQDTFWVNEVHHFGNFRQPDADSWVTVFNAVTLPKGDSP